MKKYLKAITTAVIALLVVAGLSGCGQNAGAAQEVPDLEITSGGELIAMFPDDIVDTGDFNGSQEEVDVNGQPYMKVTFSDYTKVFSKDDKESLILNNGDLELIDRDGNSVSLDEVEGPKQYEILFIKSGMQLSIFGDDTLVKVPGTAYYCSDGMKLLNYDFIMGQSILEWKDGGDAICVLFKYEIPLGWKIAILAGGVVVLAGIVLLIVLLARKKRNVIPFGAAAEGKVIGLAGMYKDAVIDLKNGEPLFFGRDSVICNVIFDERNDKVSRKHCSIRYDKKRRRYFVTDFSSNGTYLESGQRFEPDRETDLPGGTVIFLGSKENVFRLG